MLPGGKSPEVEKFLRRLFKNRIDNDWIAQHSYRKYKMHLWPFIVKKKIVKFVRCNLAMHFIADTFQLPALYIRRDPYSTIYSQQRVKFPWLYNLDHFKKQGYIVQLVNNLTGIDLMNVDLSPLETLALRYAIENYLQDHIPGIKEKSGLIKTYNYSDLEGNLNVYRSLLKYTGLEAPDNLEKWFSRPSSKTHPGSNINYGTSADYSSSFSDADKAAVDKILNPFMNLNPDNQVS